MPGAVPTWTYEAALDNGLNEIEVVPRSTPVRWLVIQARTSGSRPAERKLLVQVKFGNGQPGWWPTPVSFGDIHQEGNCEPHLDGVYITAPSAAGVVLSAQGGSA